MTQVGRIIGKGGQNVRELQRVTGSIIKLPEHGTAPAEEDTTVHIIGPFFSVQVSVPILFIEISLKILHRSLSHSTKMTNLQFNRFVVFFIVLSLLSVAFVL